MRLCRNGKQNDVFSRVHMQVFFCEIPEGTTNSLHCTTVVYCCNIKQQVYIYTYVHRYIVLNFKNHSAAKLTFQFQNRFDRKTNSKTFSGLDNNRRTFRTVGTPFVCSDAITTSTTQQLVVHNGCHTHLILSPMWCSSFCFCNFLCLLFQVFQACLLFCSRKKPKQKLCLLAGSFYQKPFDHCVITKVIVVLCIVCQGSVVYILNKAFRVLKCNVL